MRQTYGLWVQRTTADLYKKRNQRTFGLVRASNGGSSSFPYVIYNDYYSHQDFITALINSGLVVSYGRQRYVVLSLPKNGYVVFSLWFFRQWQ